MIKIIQDKDIKMAPFSFHKRKCYQYLMFYKLFVLTDMAFALGKDFQIIESESHLI